MRSRRAPKPVTQRDTAIGGWRAGSSVSAGRAWRRSTRFAGCWGLLSGCKDPTARPCGRSVPTVPGNKVATADGSQGDRDPCTGHHDRRRTRRRRPSTASIAYLAVVGRPRTGAAALASAWRGRSLAAACSSCRASAWSRRAWREPFFLPWIAVGITSLAAGVVDRGPVRYADDGRLPADRLRRDVLSGLPDSDRRRASCASRAATRRVVVGRTSSGHDVPDLLTLAFAAVIGVWQAADARPRRPARRRARPLAALSRRRGTMIVVLGRKRRGSSRSTAAAARCSAIARRS